MADTHWNKLGAYLKETQILGSIQNALYWDQNTGMPKKELLGDLNNLLILQKYCTQGIPLMHFLI